MHFTGNPDFRLHFLGIGAPPDMFTPEQNEIAYFNHRRVDYDLEALVRDRFAPDVRLRERLAGRNLAFGSTASSRGSPE
jgi:hypothetical protein